MATIGFELRSELPQLKNFTDRLNRQLPWMVRDAMAASGQSAKKAISAQIPRYIDQPVRWTTNSVIATKPHTNRLNVQIGFKDDYLTGFNSSATPAAKYLQPMAKVARKSGKEARGAKGTEKQLRRSGVIGPGQFIVPTGAAPLKFNPYGNISGSMYQTVISRLKGYNVSGFTSNASGSKQSKRKRSSLDFFTATPGGLDYGIYGRVGKKPKGTGGPGSIRGGRPVTTNLKRGFHTVFYVTDSAPRYNQTFPVEDIAAGTFTGTFRKNFFKALAKEIKVQKRKGYL